MELMVANRFEPRQRRETVVADTTRPSLYKGSTMTEWILDREHPLRAAARIFAMLCALAPLVGVIALILKHQ